MFKTGSVEKTESTRVFYLRARSLTRSYAVEAPSRGDGLVDLEPPELIRAHDHLFCLLHATVCGDPSSDSADIELC